MKEAFFKHGDKDTLRSCVKAMNFCSMESKGELQEFSNNKLKELEDELVEKLKNAMEEVEVFSFNLLDICSFRYLTPADFFF